jgi:hypothetical protein
MAASALRKTLLISLRRSEDEKPRERLKHVWICQSLFRFLVYGLYDICTFVVLGEKARAVRKVWDSDGILAVVMCTIISPEITMKLSLDSASTQKSRNLSSKERAHSMPIEASWRRSACLWWVASDVQTAARKRAVSAECGGNASGEGSHVSRSSNFRSIQLAADGLLRQVTESFSCALRPARFPHNFSRPTCTMNAER